MKGSLSNLRIAGEASPSLPFHYHLFWFLNPAVHQPASFTNKGGRTVRIFSGQTAEKQLSKTKESTLRHDNPPKPNNDQQSKAWYHHAHFPYPGKKLRSKKPVLSRKKAPSFFPQVPPFPRFFPQNSSARTSRFNKLSTTKKPIPSHTQDGSLTPTEGNSCATTPAILVFRLRVTPLARPGSARPDQSSGSQSRGGALGKPSRCRQSASEAAEV